jgi:alpha-amylase/alpha-mannosidase (GH57 family)
MSDSASMTASTKLNVVICWHMHQPSYLDRSSGEYCLPWTYLHAIKDYVDMAAHLESEPAAEAVVNFAPILLEQIDDYAQQINNYFMQGSRITDPLLCALGGAVLPVGIGERIKLVQDCLRANKERLIDRYDNYQRLTELADWFLKHQDANIYINDQFLVDIIVWYHLAWLGETVRREDKRTEDLIKKGSGYTLHERRVLLEVIGDLLSGVIPRYKALAESGKVELSTSPYAHPIVPLLLDLQTAKEAMPDAPMPLLEAYPGGEERARWQIQYGVEVFERYFGFKPLGCWPSEGSVSDAAINLFEQSGFSWVASGESVLSNSLHQTAKIKEQEHNPDHCRAFCLEGHEMACFFRDDGLSDLVGFTYSTWHADDAVANLVHHLENIAGAINGDTSQYVVPIILDGENAWEYYPENGYYFLNSLYKQIAEHPKLNLTTFSSCLERHVPKIPLPHIVAGSWVYGTFSTWIGDADKNRAWDMLGDVKRIFDKAIASNHLSDEQRTAAEIQLAICEGSDWFWWFGDYNPSDTVSDFDHLFRMQLVNLCQLLGEEPPEYLSHAFAHGSGAPQLGGVMRRGSEHE